MEGSVAAPRFAIEPLLPEDWPAVRRIYEEGLGTDHSTLEIEVPTWEAWDAGHLPGCRLVARVGGETAGWVALNSVSPRRVYAGVAEVSVYVGEAWRGKGVGAALLSAAAAESERLGVWTLQSAVLAGNARSVALHERAGFRLVGRRERLGRRLGVWRDVLLFERRSAVVGCEED